MAYANIISGVYSLTNTQTGKIYIGSTQNALARRNCHFSQLRCNRHPNQEMLSDYEKHGLDSFEFHILEEVSPDQLRDVEQTYIDLLPVETRYNIADNARGGIGPVSEKARRRMSKTRKGKKRTQEQRERMGSRQRGPNHHRFEGYYVTPTGHYTSGKAASLDIAIDTTTIIAWCKKRSDKPIPKVSYDLSAYLKALGPNVIGKTYREIGFYFIANK